MAQGWTPGPWAAAEPLSGEVYSTARHQSVCMVLLRGDEGDANIRLIAAAPDMAAAVRAHHAWAYCEHHSLGTFDQRGILCAHAEYLTAKAMARIEGRDFDAEYAGRKRLVVWPQVRLEESTEADAEALIAEALAHETAALSAARGDA